VIGMPFRRIITLLLPLLLPLVNLTASSLEKYAALGDSVPAGYGLQGAAAQTCQRSAGDNSANKSYPDVMRDALGLPADKQHYAKLACSGATSKTVVKQAIDAGAFLGSDPALVTITVGANDFHFADQSTYIAAFDPRGYPAFTAYRTLWSTTVRRNLLEALTELGKGSGKSQRRIVVTGYYNPFNARSWMYRLADALLGAECGKTKSGRPPCAQIMAESVQTLNDAIAGAVRDYAGTPQDAKVILVNGVVGRFLGHESSRFTCGSAVPDQNASYIQVFPDCFHPNAEGHRQLADLVKDSMTATAWTAAEPMVSAHGNTAMARLKDGRLLVVSGQDVPGHVTATAELYDPATGHWSRTGDVNQARDSFRQPVTLPDGKVLMAAGSDENATADHATAELYDPATERWSYTGSLATSRRYPVIVGLRDGRVLAATGAHGPPDGSRFLSSAELYDPATGRWAFTGDAIVRRESASGILLDDGRVLLLGGYTCCDVFPPTTELYDPATGAWTQAGDLPSGRSGAALVVLRDGRVLAAGGGSNTSNGPLAEALLFDPGTGRWTATQNMRLARGGAAAALLEDGRVLVAGGGPLQGEIYDPTTGAWSLDVSLALPHPGGAMAKLPGGRFLMAGGGTGEDGRATEIYQP
jgi:lysophospholipase L1-like esterase